MAISIEVDPISSPRIITVLAPTTTVSAQELLDAMRGWENEWHALEFDHLVDAAGKESLGGGAAVGITLTLRNARLKFADRLGPTWTLCAVQGGNLVAVDSGGLPMDAIEPSAYVTVNSQASSSPTIANLEITRLKYMLESLRSTHQGFGSAFWVDPVGGNDGLAGDSPERAVKTFAKAHDLVVSGRGDTIYFLSTAAGMVTLDEACVISKEDVHLRGPGRGFQIRPSTNIVPLTVNAANCSASGFIVRAPDGSTTIDCIVVNDKFFRAEKLYVVGAGQTVGSGHGIHFRGGDYHEMCDMSIEKCGGSGIFLSDPGLSSGAPRELTVCRSIIYLNGRSGIEITSDLAAPLGTSTRLNRFYATHIHSNLRYGIEISANTFMTYIGRLDGGVSAHDNTLGDILDAGVDTHDDSTPIDDEQSQVAELHRLAGLESGTPLTVSASQRQAGSVVQSITEAGGVVTVTRT